MQRVPPRKKADPSRVRPGKSPARAKSKLSRASPAGSPRRSNETESVAEVARLRVLHGPPVWRLGLCIARNSWLAARLGIRRAGCDFQGEEHLEFRLRAPLLKHDSQVKSRLHLANFIANPPPYHGRHAPIVHHNGRLA